MPVLRIVTIFNFASSNFAQIDFSSNGDRDCLSCVRNNQTGLCESYDVSKATASIAGSGMGLGIPFVVAGATFGVVWIVIAVIQPTKNRAKN